MRVKQALDKKALRLHLILHRTDLLRQKAYALVLVKVFLLDVEPTVMTQNGHVVAASHVVVVEDAGNLYLAVVAGDRLELAAVLVRMQLGESSRHLTTKCVVGALNLNFAVGLKEETVRVSEGLRLASEWTLHLAGEPARKAHFAEHVLALRTGLRPHYEVEADLAEEVLDVVGCYREHNALLTDDAPLFL